MSTLVQYRGEPQGETWLHAGVPHVDAIRALVRRGWRCLWAAMTTALRGLKASDRLGSLSWGEWCASASIQRREGPILVAVSWALRTFHKIRAGLSASRASETEY